MPSNLQALVWDVRSGDDGGTRPNEERFDRRLRRLQDGGDLAVGEVAPVPQDKGLVLGLGQLVQDRPHPVEVRPRVGGVVEEGTGQRLQLVRCRRLVAVAAEGARARADHGGEPGARGYDLTAAGEMTVRLE